MRSAAVKIKNIPRVSVGSGDVFPGLLATEHWSLMHEIFQIDEGFFPPIFFYGCFFMLRGNHWKGMAAEKSRITKRDCFQIIVLVPVLLNFFRFFVSSFFLWCIRISLLFFFSIFHFLGTEYMYVCTLYIHVISYIRSRDFG